ncbi:PTS transporter subunit IIC [Robertmurraya kyonggiensis]|uniref:PTS sugar transporter subunit IIC n=1 Tax=Robertmurraya kyonggiensis TaxID=1037680 RepID=A0A4U1D1A9_9BACI|nr:PTS sugar transporter subunit IIC [Robertmurraya kyonggiensis]TKC15854.1 PTS sugar transporter subunit IIC [Robertmurraya kyonggiensis]
MKKFLEKKGVSLSLKAYFIDSLNGMALGLFSSLIIGLIIKTIGEQLDIAFLVEIGTMAMGLMGPAIGVAVAYSLKAPPLVLFAAIFSGAAGGTLGGEAGAFVAALISVELGKIVSKETRIDIIVTPLVTILTGFAVAKVVGPAVDYAMKAVGDLIVWSTDQQPILMGIVISVAMGLALTYPISSAAIAMMLDLNGIAAGAAVIGCAAQMIGFAASSYRENKISGLISLGVGTSSLLAPNSIRNPWIIIPPTVAGIILAPIGTTLLDFHNNAAGAGMGTSGLVGPMMTFTTMGFGPDVWIKVILLLFVGPAVISLLLSEYMRKKGWIKSGDMLIQIEGARE